MKVRCKLGPYVAHCGGHTYDFSIDDKGRAVAEVFNAEHIKCFLAVEHYEEVVDEEPPVEAVDVEEQAIEQTEENDGISPSEPAVAQPVRRGRKARPA